MKKNRKKIKIKYKNVFKFLICLILIILSIKYILNLSITNIYISGNNLLSDSYIMDVAKISDYPKIITTPNYKIKKLLLKDDDIYKVNVYKKWTKLYIEIEENIPLFYNSNLSSVVMLDKSVRKSNIITPYLVNYIPDTIYSSFVDTMSNVDREILSRISEIEYTPNDVDSERFLLTMSDGNYIYVTLRTFTKVNNYIEMLKQFKGENGILYLDSGEYFEIKN